MVKSRFCHLHTLPEIALTQRGASAPTMSLRGDCPFDTGGYFIIKGSEKVLSFHLTSSVSQLGRKQKRWILLKLRSFMFQLSVDLDKN